jgi:hypothetical protein
MIMATAKEPARSPLMYEDFVRHFRDFFAAVLERGSLKQILSRDESQVAAAPFKEKKRKMTLLTSCQTEPRFQHAKDVTQLSVMDPRNRPRTTRRRWLRHRQKLNRGIETRSCLSYPQGGQRHAKCEF